MTNGVTPIAVIVTPLDVTGNHVDCDISGPTGANFRVAGGVIFLKPGNAFDISFNLAPGQVPALEWAADPLWIECNKCPRGKKTEAPFHTPAKKSGKQANVGVNSSSDAKIIHYRMNFLDGHKPLSCDPIIIHE